MLLECQVKKKFVGYNKNRYISIHKGFLLYVCRRWGGLVVVLQALREYYSCDH